MTKSRIKMLRSLLAEYLTFISVNGDDKKEIELWYVDENIWMTQKMMAGFMVCQFKQLGNI
jgi:hypothetical protein